MKKEIEKLLASTSGTLAINPACVLCKKTENEHSYLSVKFFSPVGRFNSCFTIKPEKQGKWIDVAREIVRLQSIFYNALANELNVELIDRGHLYGEDDAIRTAKKADLSGAPMLKDWEKDAEDWDVGRINIYWGYGV